MPNFTTYYHQNTPAYDLLFGILSSFSIINMLVTHVKQKYCICKFATHKIIYKQNTRMRESITFTYVVISRDDTEVHVAVLGT